MKFFLSFLADTTIHKYITFLCLFNSVSEVVWEQCFLRQYSDLHRRVQAKQDARFTRRSWRAEFARRHTIGRSVARLVGGMSARFHNVSELSPDDFADFDDLMLGQNPDRGYVVDELLALLQGQEREKDRHKNMTVKYYAAKVLRHVQHRLLGPQIADFLEAAEAADIVNGDTNRYS